jgi:DNA-directed DNA polymerase III PolC
VFTHLHTHSYFSFHDGVAAPADLAQAAARLGMEALALTDHDALTGAVEFFSACRQQQVRPILGLELPVAPPAGWVDQRAGPLVLLAMDMAGWRSLCRLSSALLEDAERDGQHGLPFERFCRDTAGLLCLSGGRRGLAARSLAARQPALAAEWLGRLAELFDDRLYVELTPCGAASAELWERLTGQARRLGLSTVATNSVHTLSAGQALLQRTLTAIRLNRPLDQLPPDAPALAGTDFISGDEMARRFADHPHAVARTGEAASRCRLELPLGVPHYPEVPLPEGQTPLAALHAKAYAGARQRYGTLTAAIEARLEHELGVIGERGYAPLFLIMEEIMDFARATGVPTSSRGSAASSLVAHCLGITTPDPLRLNLYFERFLNPARSSPPDIDTDLCSRRRDGVIRHVYDTYGDERVAMVCTLQRYRARSALREAAKALGFAPAEITTLAGELPYRGWGPPPKDDGETDDEPDTGPRDAVAAGPFALLAERHTGERHRQLFERATAMLGLPRHLSVHPGGVVITPGPMTDLVPRYYSTKGVVITQFDLESVARLGLLKIDLLGIRGLTVLGDMVAVLPAPDAASAPASPLASLEAIRDDDEATRALVRAGRTIGCFQIESPGMRATLKEVGADSVDDLMVALALYRPGPLTGGLKEAFVQRHLGRKATEHLHPALEPLLGDTFGVFLYQEQVLRVAHELAGLSLAEADLLRRAMSHFDPGQQMVTLKQKFMAGALARNGVPAETAERVWELMAAFAGYGFPKAHAASYAQVAWRAAWCKAHFPAEFLAAVLANWGGYYGQQVYLTEARRWGLRLKPPHINHAGREFGVVRVGEETWLTMGLNQVRDLTQRTAQRLLRERPFASLADFLARVDPRPVEAENLVRVGALAGLGSIPGLLRELKGAGRRPGQMALFGAEALGEPGDSEEWPLPERVAAQQALLGVGVDAHPLELVASQIEASGALSTVAAVSQLNRRVRVAGTRQTWHRTRTVRGDYIYFMALEDLEGMLDVVVFSDVYRRHQAAFASRAPLVLEGQVEMDPGRGEPILRAERAWAIE